MLKTLIRCPNCKSKIPIEDARVEIPEPEKSTWRYTYYLVYTFCPSCKQNLNIKGEKKGAIFLLLLIFALMALGYYTHQKWTIVVLFGVIFLGPKITQLFIRVENA